MFYKLIITIIVVDITLRTGLIQCLHLTLLYCTLWNSTFIHGFALNTYVLRTYVALLLLILPCVLLSLMYIVIFCRFRSSENHPVNATYSKNGKIVTCFWTVVRISLSAMARADTNLYIHRAQK